MTKKEGPAGTKPKKTRDRQTPFVVRYLNVHMDRHERGKKN